MGALEWEQFGISNTELLESEGLLRALPIALASVALILKRGVYNGTPSSKVRSNSVWLLSRVLICFYCYKLDSANGFVARFFQSKFKVTPPCTLLTQFHSLLLLSRREGYTGDAL